MSRRKDGPEHGGAGHYAGHTNEDNDGQNPERRVGASVNVRVAVLVDTEHAHHCDHVHEARI